MKTVQEVQARTHTHIQLKIRSKKNPLKCYSNRTSISSVRAALSKPSFLQCSYTNTKQHLLGACRIVFIAFYLVKSLAVWFPDIKIITLSSPSHVLSYPMMLCTVPCFCTCSFLSCSTISSCTRHIFLASPWALQPLCYLSSVTDVHDTIALLL